MYDGLGRKSQRRQTNGGGALSKSNLLYTSTAAGLFCRG